MENAANWDRNRNIKWKQQPKDYRNQDNTPVKHLVFQESISPQWTNKWTIKWNHGNLKTAPATKAKTQAHKVLDNSYILLEIRGQVCGLGLSGEPSDIQRVLWHPLDNIYPTSLT